jgi:hypothetical protein
MKGSNVVKLSILKSLIVEQIGDTPSRSKSTTARRIALAYPQNGKKFHRVILRVFLCSSRSAISLQLQNPPVKAVFFRILKARYLKEII